MGSCFGKKTRGAGDILIFDFRVNKPRKTGEHDSIESLFEFFEPDVPKLNLETNIMWQRRLKTRRNEKGSHLI